MLKRKVLEFEAGRRALPGCQSNWGEPVADLPAVPVLPETLLLMELTVSEPYVNLTQMTELVLGDLGATLQILRLAGREYGGAPGRPTRIEDCISDLGLQACLDAASNRTITRGNRQSAIVETWAHSREIAKYCRFVAEEMSPSISPEEAYLTGLFHALGSLPAILGWDCSMQGWRDSAFVGLHMARHWALPRCVVEFFREMQPAGSVTHWSGIVHTAHLLASAHESIASAYERAQPSVACMRPS